MWLVIAGVIVLVAGSVDLIWTTLGTHGGGPISAPIAKILWKGMTAIHRRTPQHRLLSFGGSVILLSLIGFWLLMLLAGWTLVFEGAPHAVVELQTRHPADFVGRVYFVGAMMFTAGTSEYAPAGPVWQIAAILVSASGLFVVTLSITYLLAVLGAIVEKRALASAIWDMGATSEGLIDRAWAGDHFSALDNPMTHLMTGIEAFAEQQLAYPILQYFHAENHRTAAPLRIAALHDALLLMCKGVVPEKRPPKIVALSALDSIRGFAEVIAKEYVSEPDDPPPPPDLEILRSRNIPVVDAATFNAAVEAANDARRRLLGMVTDAGWEWKDVFDRNLKPATAASAR
jgi:hypothetical protein